VTSPMTPAVEGGAGQANEDLRAALDAVVRESLRPVALGLGVLYLVFAVSHALLLPKSVATPMAVLAAGTAVALLGLHYALSRRAIPLRWAHPVGAFVAGLALLNSLLHIYLTAEPRQTTNLMLLVVGAGFFFLSAGWLTLVLAAALAGWGVVVSLASPSAAWLHFGFALFTATVLAVLVHTVRVRALRRLERLRLQEDLQRARLEKALHAVQWSERRLGTLLESAPQGLVLVNDDGCITLVNAGIEQMFGYDREELLGHPLGQLIPESLRGVHAEYCAGYFDNPSVRPMGTGLDLVGRRKDGTALPVDISLSHIMTEDETLAIAFIVDITRRKQAEQALQEYSERLEDMVEERTQELREAQAQLLAQQRLQQEIELAAQIQVSLLPRQVPSLDGFEFAAKALPARYVGGDLYDFVLCGEQAYHIVLADIAGKGVPAAMLALTARTLLRAETDHDDSPANILSNVNRSFYEDLAHAEMFITFLTARLDAPTGTLTYASAGHTETLWWQQADQTCHTLPSTGLPIGIFPDAVIAEETLVLRPGDVLVFYSDGVTEASNRRDELFGLDRLRDLVDTHARLPADELCQVVVEDVEAFCAGVPRSDDLTLVVLKALPRTVSFTYPATLENLHEVTTLVRQAASAYGDDFAYQMELATSEIVTNVIKHAYHLSSGEVRGQITLLPDQAQLDLYDDGVSFDPSSIPAPDLTEPQEGGYGLYIADQMVDELVYTPASPEGNHWRMTKHA
jgi:PAS domain S-box-containing protein